MSKAVNLVLCWHMHQPYYKEGLDGKYHLPWVYLHGIKDYADMAYHLEQHPKMKAVVNFAPVLLEQLDDYSQQLKSYLDDGSPLQDELLNILSGAKPVPSEAKARKQLIDACRRAHAPRMIEPYTLFSKLSRMFNCIPDKSSGDFNNFVMEYLDPQYFIDLLVWYHLAWMGRSLKSNSIVKALMNKGKHFSPEDRRLLMETIHEVISNLIPRYKKLADQKQIELSMTPYAHPIIPLLQDFSVMYDAMPDAPAPIYSHYPNGKERTRWHMHKGLEVFDHYFGRKPKGVWLSEGGISNEAVKLLDEMKIKWTASGEAVWKNSCIASTGCDPNIDHDGVRPLFQHYVLDKCKTRIYFRDDGLSDLVGFEYRNWHADDAVANFINHIETIAKTLGKKAGKHVVSVILDGENAWEYYPENGHYFLNALYEKLTDNKLINVTTFDAIGKKMVEDNLSTIVAGSWVYGSFSTWIGSEDKNRAWDLLVEAKEAFNSVIDNGGLSEDQREAAKQQLAICESSDWFWWFGDYNPADSVSDFDLLYRQQLKLLYKLLGLPEPENLSEPVSSGSTEESVYGGAMLRNV